MFSQTAYTPAMLAFFSEHLEEREFFESLDDETQQKLLDSGGDFEDHLEAMMKKK